MKRRDFLKAIPALGAAIAGIFAFKKPAQVSNGLVKGDYLISPDGRSFVVTEDEISGVSLLNKAKEQITRADEKPIELYEQIPVKYVGGQAYMSKERVYADNIKRAQARFHYVENLHVNRLKPWTDG